jgi:poly(A) polymerase
MTVPVQPTLYHADNHTIDSSAIDPDALFVIERLQEAGHTAYLVGGGVRDLLFGRRPKDFDVSTSARPEEVRRLFRHCLLIGRRFRLAHVRFGPKVIEVSTFRAGDPASDELIVHDNEWGTPEEDVLRRDFTINGLYYDPSEHTVIDYVGGFADIQRRRLVTIGVPEVRFRQDPVRMIRLLKFRARFGLEVEEQTEKALWACTSEIRKSAPARVLEELLRMLESGAAESFFRLMVESGLMPQVMPEVARALMGPDGREMYKALKAIDLLQAGGKRKKPFDRAVLVAAFFWPLFEALVHADAASEGHPPHLGQVLELADLLLHELLEDAPPFPKRLRWAVAGVLTDQFRLTPMEKQKVGRSRMSSADRALAMDLLKIRAALKPELVPVFERLRAETRQGGHARRQESADSR